MGELGETKTFRPLFSSGAYRALFLFGVDLVHLFEKTLPLFFGVTALDAVPSHLGKTEQRRSSEFVNTPRLTLAGEGDRLTASPIVFDFEDAGGVSQGCDIILTTRRNRVFALAEFAFGLCDG